MMTKYYLLRSADMKSHKKTNKKQDRKISRRDFIGGAAASVAGFAIVPRHVLGVPAYTPPSEKPNIAGIGAGGQAATALELDFHQEPRGREGKTFTPVLDIRHPQIGLVCEHQCYETGPFQQGTGTRKKDGSIVLTCRSGKMTAITTFTLVAEGRISMDIVVEGPLEQLRKVAYMGACMQYRHSEAFKRKGDLVGFAERCFIYTMRGPLGMLDTARGRMKSFKPDSHENNPPCTQWYIPVDRAHPGDPYAFGTSGDRPVYGLVGVTSHDGKWLAAIGCRYNLNLGQGWIDCIHVVPPLQQRYLDEKTGRIIQRSMIYVMPNDHRALLDAFRQDFPPVSEESEFEVSAGKDGILQLKPSAKGRPGLELSIDTVDDGRRKTEPDLTWEPTYWGSFVRSGESWRMWAHPFGDSLELCVSSKVGQWNPDLARAAVQLSGKGWVPAKPPKAVPVQVLCSADGKWTAGFFWERSELDRPAWGIPTRGEKDGDTVSVRGRLCIYEGGPNALAERWSWASNDWNNAVPYRMPAGDRGALQSLYIR